MVLAERAYQQVYHQQVYQSAQGKDDNSPSQQGRRETRKTVIESRGFDYVELIGSRQRIPSGPVGHNLLAEKKPTPKGRTHDRTFC
jgi:hypothetical protein